MQIYPTETTVISKSTIKNMKSKENLKLWFTKSVENLSLRNRFDEMKLTTNIPISYQNQTNSALMLWSSCCHMTEYKILNKMVRINNFPHTLIIYMDFMILCPLHFNVCCNFACKYVLTSSILNQVHNLLSWLWKCVSRTS